MFVFVRLLIVVVIVFCTSEGRSGVQLVESIRIRVETLPGASVCFPVSHSKGSTCHHDAAHSDTPCLSSYMCVETAVGCLSRLRMFDGPQRATVERHGWEDEKHLIHPRGHTAGKLHMILFLVLYLVLAVLD